MTNSDQSALLIKPSPGDGPILSAEMGDDYETHVLFGQLGVRVVSLNSSNRPMPMPHLSSDEARDLAARLLYAADRLDEH